MLDFLEQGFITFLNMSITGSYIILAIILLRFALKKAPKVFSYCLWAVAGLRLIFPFSFSSALSIFNLFSAPADTSVVSGATSSGYIPQDIGNMMMPEISIGIPAADNAINPALPITNHVDSVNPMQIITNAASVLWATGIAVMLIYGIVSLIKVINQIKFATKIDGNVFECDKVPSPFVFGIFKPKIYLPCNLPEKQREHIVLHERRHIKRLDHITKLVSFVILTLHWFNPLVWIAYSLMVRDMEMSCDEGVLKHLGAEAKKDYGLTLVQMGTKKKFAAALPLSFGENGVRKRVVNILNFKKPKVIAIILCVAVCIVAAAVCLTNGVNKTDEIEEMQTKIEEYCNNQHAIISAENDYYEYNLSITGVKIVSVSEDKSTAYGWHRVFSFDSHYSELLRYDDYLYPVEVPHAIRFKASFDENGEVTEVLSIESEIPELPETIAYDFDVRESAYKTAEKTLKRLFKNVKIYETENSITKYQGDRQPGLEMNNAELVSDCYGKPVLAIVFQNTNEEASYNISNYFSFGRGTPHIELPSVQNYEHKVPFDDGQLHIPSGKNTKKEVLYFADLSKYIDTVEEGYYNLTLYVQNSPEDAYSEFQVNINVKNSEPSRKKPAVTYESLELGNNPPLFSGRNRGKFVEGTMCISRLSENTINLTEKELNDIEKALNSGLFTIQARNNDPFRGYTFHIKDQYGKNYNFIVDGKTVTDCNAAVTDDNCYEFGHSKLFQIAEKIYENSDFYDPRIEVGTTSPAITEPHTPQQNPVKVEPSTIQNQTTTETKKQEFVTIPSASVTEPDYEPKTEYVLTDISYSFDGISEVSLIAAKISGANSLHLHIINRADSNYYHTDDYTLKNQQGDMKPLREIDSNKIHTIYGKDKYVIRHAAYLPLNKYFNNPESGRYKLILPIYTDENMSSTGNLTLEFTLTKCSLSQAPAASKITNPTAVNINLADYSVDYSYSQFKEADMRKTADMINSLKLIPIEKPLDYGKGLSLYVTVVDENVREHTFIIHGNGVIYQNGNYYLAVNGEKLHSYLESFILSAEKANT